MWKIRSINIARYWYRRILSEWGGGNGGENAFRNVEIASRSMLPLTRMPPRYFSILANWRQTVRSERNANRDRERLTRSRLHTREYIHVFCIAALFPTDRAREPSIFSSFFNPIAKERGSIRESLQTCTFSLIYNQMRNQPLHNEEIH